jgi:hypothetical protein
MYHQLFYLLLLTMMSMATTDIEDESQELAICKEILKSTEVMKEQAKLLYSVLIRKGKITTETTYEWAKSSDTLRVAVMKWLGLALSKDPSRNWSEQTMMSDYELWNEHGNKSIKEWCRMNFPHDNDLRLKNEKILIKQRSRIYNRLYTLFHLVCNEMDLPHQPKPTPEELAEKAMNAIVPDNTPTKNTANEEKTVCYLYLTFFKYNFNIVSIIGRWCF